MRRQPVFPRQINALPIQHRGQILDVVFGKISHLIIPEVAVTFALNISEFIGTIGFIVACQKSYLSALAVPYSPGEDKTVTLHYRGGTKAAVAVSFKSRAVRIGGSLIGRPLGGALRSLISEVYSIPA